MSDKIIYTAEDIRLYLEGKMSPAQKHALEKAALSDPFLADALEGMEMHGNTEKFKADVEELHARLAGRVKNKKGALASVNSLWWKVAAVLFIVITGVAVIIFTGEKNKTVQYEIAKTENKIDRDDKKLNREQEARKEEIKDSEATVDEIKQKETKQEETKQNPQLAKSKEPAHYKKVETENIEKADEANIQREIRASEKPSAAAVEKPSAATAPVADSVLKAETMARAESQNQTKVSNQLEGRAAGVRAENAEIADSAYDEVVVVGYGTSKKNKNNRRILSADRTEKRIIPQNGWEEFEQYIKDSTKITTADSVFTGEEHLSFTIGDDGLPESIKILRSISPSHDKEAIRLLQNGPSWKVAKGRRREIRLKIIF